MRPPAIEGPLEFDIGQWDINITWDQPLAASGKDLLYEVRIYTLADEDEKFMVRLRLT